MILIVSTHWEFLSGSEFLMPVIKILEKQGLVERKDYDKVDYHLDVRKWLTNKVTHVIITGTALADFDYLSDDIDWSWLKELKIPVLGICAGAQVIAKEFGWKLTKTRRIGVQKVEVVKENSLLQTDSSGYFLHSYDLTGGDVLAESEKVPALLKVKDRPIFACVFHPEVMTQSIITNFIAKDLNK